MAKQISLFQFTGTLGNAVGYRYRGEYCIRRKPVQNQRSPSMAQLVQQGKFATAAKFAMGIKALLQVSYTRFHGNMTAANHLIRFILKNALTGEYPAFGIAYNKVPVARGNMPATFGAARAIPGQVEFTWGNNPEYDRGNATDRAILVVYVEAFNSWIYTTAGPPRSDGVGTIGIPGLSGFTAHTWLGFISEDGNEVANSWYTGKLIIN